MTNIHTMYTRLMLGDENPLRFTSVVLFELK